MTVSMLLHQVDDIQKTSETNEAREIRFKSAICVLKNKKLIMSKPIGSEEQFIFKK